MGGNNSCCVRDPNESKLETEAQQSRSQKSQTGSPETESMLQWDKENINKPSRTNDTFTTDHRARSSSKEVIEHKLSNTESRDSYENSPSNEMETDTTVTVSLTPSKKKHKKKKKKHRNKLVSELKQCINEFNKSLRGVSLLELMSTENTMNEYNQKELLDTDEICKYFRNKKYDIQWFLCTKRNKFIIILVNKWPHISILTTIKIYNMLQEKIHKITPSISKSTMNLVSTLNAKSIGKRTKKSRKHQQNIIFTWKDSIHDIDDCDIHHFLHVSSLIIKNENRDYLQNNALFKQSMMGALKSLYNQYELLTYLLEIEMNGYLFRGINKHIFFVNIDKFAVDIPNNSKSNENEEILIKKYCDNLYDKINAFEISKIYKQSVCTVEFTLGNSKRWESVSSLIADTQLSQYGVADLLIDDDDDEEEDSDEEESDSNEQDCVTPRTQLKETKTVTQAMKELRDRKATMSTEQYLKEMERLQEQLTNL